MHQNLMVNPLVKCVRDGLGLLWNGEEVERRTYRGELHGVIGGGLEDNFGCYGLLDTAAVLNIGCTDIIG